MARLPEIKRIQREDIAEADSWITKLLFPLNRFMETVYSALNKQLTLQENIRASIASIDVETASDYELNNTFEEINLSKNFNENATAVFIGQIYERGKEFDKIINPVQVDWIESQGQIKIKFISGLSNSTKYKIKLIIL